MARRAAHHHFMRRAQIFPHATLDGAEGEKYVEYHKYLIEFSV